MKLRAPIKPKYAIYSIAACAILTGATALFPINLLAQASTVAKPGEAVTLNFSNAEIEAVARTMATITGRNVVVDPRVKGTMTLVTDKPCQPPWRYNQFLAALRLQGFTVVEAAGLYKVVPEADAKLQSGAVTVSDEAIGGALGNQIMTQIFKLNYESANNLVAGVAPADQPEQHHQRQPRQQLAGHHRLRRQPAPHGAHHRRAWTWPMPPTSRSCRSSTPLPPTWRRWCCGWWSPRRAGTAPGQADTSFKTTLVAEPRSNALILRAANPARVALVKSLVDKLDQPGGAGHQWRGGQYLCGLPEERRRHQTGRHLARGHDRSRPPAAAATPGVAGAAPAAAMAATPAIHRRTDPGRSGHQLAHHHRARAAVPPAARGDRPARCAARPGACGEPDCRGQRRQGGRIRHPVAGRRWARPATARRPAGHQLRHRRQQHHQRWQPGARRPVAPAAGLNFGAGQPDQRRLRAGLSGALSGDSGSGNMLSTPNLLTLDNEEAKIVIGQNVPFITGQYTNTGHQRHSVNPFQTIERKDVGLTLKVKPQISENGTVKLAIYQEVSSVQASTDQRGQRPDHQQAHHRIQRAGGRRRHRGAGRPAAGRVFGQPGKGARPGRRARSLATCSRARRARRKKTNLMVFLRPVVVRDAHASEQLSHGPLRLDALGAERSAAGAEHAGAGQRGAATARAAGFPAGHPAASRLARRPPLNPDSAASANAMRYPLPYAFARTQQLLLEDDGGRPDAVAAPATRAGQRRSAKSCASTRCTTAGAGRRRR